MALPRFLSRFSLDFFLLGPGRHPCARTSSYRSSAVPAVPCVFSLAVFPCGVDLSSPIFWASWDQVKSSCQMEFMAWGGWGSPLYGAHYVISGGSRGLIGFVGSVRFSSGRSPCAWSCENTTVLIEFWSFYTHPFECLKKGNILFPAPFDYLTFWPNRSSIQIMNPPPPPLCFSLCSPPPLACWS